MVARGLLVLRVLGCLGSHDNWLLRPSSVLRRRVFYSECLEAVENHHRKHKKNQIQKNHHTGYVWSAGDTLARYPV